MDLLGDIGGVTEIFMVIFGALFASWTEHKFVLKALENLYFAKTKDKITFKDSQKCLKQKDLDDID